MSFRYALSAPIQDFYVGTNYDAFGPEGLKSIAELQNQAMLSDSEVAGAEKQAEALQKMMKYRTQADLALQGPQQPSGFQRAMGMVQDGLSIAGGLKGMGAFGSGTPITDGFDGLGGFGPTASGDAYGGFLDATAGTTGMGPLMSGDAYGSFLSRP